MILRHTLPTDRVPASRITFLFIHVLIPVWVLFRPCPGSAQVGPNSPSSVVNNTGVGSLSWTTPGNATASDNAYAAIGAKGVSNYLLASGFGFSIPSPSSILGIRASIERSTSSPQDVALHDGWTTGLSKTITAGADRCLVVAYAQENGINSRDITAMTYGDRSMTQVAEVAIGTVGGFMARLEVWILLESQIALASGTAIVPTYETFTPHEYCEAFSAAVFRNVDQSNPVVASQTSGAVASTDPHQLSAAISIPAGGMAINVVTCGNNTTPANTNGGTNTYTINSGYTEGTDLYFANTVDAPTSGACLQTAHKAIATAGTEQPSCDFAGSVNRWAMIGFALQRAANRDNQIRLVKGGTVTGSNLASSTVWPTTDVTANYGGATELWGTSWTVADINASDFGAAISTSINNGTARVDHITLSVWFMSTLPIELIDFRAASDGAVVRLDWATATETNNHHFVVQRSRDGIVFEDAVYQPGAGHSTSTLFYSAVDQDPYPGTSYYRLKQVDIDGTSTTSAIVPVVRMSHANGLLVHPNPTSDGTITIHDVRLERDHVAVFTNDMKLVRTHVGAGADPVIHLNDLPDGTYILQVRSGDEVRTTRVVKASRTL